MSNERPDLDFGYQFGYFAKAYTDFGQGFHSCNCIGPQPGQTKCPCLMRNEEKWPSKKN